MYEKCSILQDVDVRYAADTVNPCRICGEPANGKFCYECEAAILAKIEQCRPSGKSVFSRNIGVVHNGGLRPTMTITVDTDRMEWIKEG